MQADKETRKYEKQLNQTINKLSKKYGISRKVNEKVLFTQKPVWQKVLIIAFDIISVLFVLFSTTLCVNMINSKIQDTPTTFLGYSTILIANNSMAPNFVTGDGVLVHAVNPYTLEAGDLIAFYAYSDNTYDTSKLVLVSSLTNIEDVEHDVEYVNNFALFWGVQPKSIQDAAQAGAQLVFHRIEKIYEDPETHERFFVTKGDNDADIDMWVYIPQEYIIGILVHKEFAYWFANLVVHETYSWTLLLAILFSFICLAVAVLLDLLKIAQIVKLELDCVEEKRKITDPICVKNQVGYRMSKQDKFKVLATASEEDKEAYVKLLWKEGKAPTAIRKYFIRRRLILAPLEKLRDINRQCEKMYADGESMTKIATFYQKERAKVEFEADSRYERLKKLK